MSLFAQTCAAGILGGLLVLGGIRAVESRTPKDSSRLEDVLHGREHVVASLVLNDILYNLMCLEKLKAGKQEEVCNQMRFQVYVNGDMLGGESLYLQIPEGPLRDQYLAVWREWLSHKDRAQAKKPE